MFRLSSFLGLVAASTLAAAAPAHADTGPVSLKGDVKLVRVMAAANGSQTRQLVEPTNAVPGDMVIFSTAYHNDSSTNVADFIVVNALPAAVKLAPQADAALSVSVDGGQNWGRLGELTVKDASGVARAAIAADVTHVRWVLANLDPQQGGTVEYPAIIR